MQSPCEEYGSIESVKMRQVAMMEVRHEKQWRRAGEFLTEKEGRLPIGRRLPTCPTTRRPSDRRAATETTGAVIFATAPQCTYTVSFLDQGS